MIPIELICRGRVPMAALPEEVKKVEEITAQELNQYLENIAKLIEATAKGPMDAAEIVRDSKITA